MVPHPPPQFDAVEHCPAHPVVTTKTRRAWWTWALGWGLVRNEDVEETPCSLCVDTAGELPIEA